MADERVCVILGRDADVTACLLSQVLAPLGRTGLTAVTAGFDREEHIPLPELKTLGCRHIVVALPEDAVVDGCTSADTAVILTRGTGEAARELVGRCHNAVINLDDPDGADFVPADGARVWTISERRDQADLIAKNLRIKPFRTEFEAVSQTDIRRLSVLLPAGRGLYPALATAAAALTFGVALEDTARRLRRAEPVPVGMTSVWARACCVAGYFDAQGPDS